MRGLGRVKKNFPYLLIIFQIAKGSSWTSGCSSDAWITNGHDGSLQRGWHSVQAFQSGATLPVSDTAPTLSHSTLSLPCDTFPPTHHHHKAFLFSLLHVGPLQQLSLAAIYDGWKVFYECQFWQILKTGLGLLQTEGLTKNNIYSQPFLGSSQSSYFNSMLWFVNGKKNN